MSDANGCSGGFTFFNDMCPALNTKTIGRERGGGSGGGGAYTMTGRLFRISPKTHYNLSRF